MSINMNRFNGAINTLRARGYTIIAPNYSLARDRESPFPQCIKDIFTAIEWSRSHADSLKIDIHNCTYMGESAGAHLAMIAAYASPNDFGLSYDKLLANRVIDVYGPSELHTLYHSGKVDTANSILAKLPPSLHKKLDLPTHLFGFNPSGNDSLTRAFTNQYSPINYLDSKDPTTLIIHGKIDAVVPISQSDTLLSILNINDVNSQYHFMNHTNHSFLESSKEQRDSVQTWIIDFILNN